MGALLSLPLLAVPTMGTVRRNPDCHALMTANATYLPACDICCIMLWRGYMLSGLQCLWKVSGQVIISLLFHCCETMIVTGR